MIFDGNGLRVAVILTAFAGTPLAWIQTASARGGGGFDEDGGGAGTPGAGAGAGAAGGERVVPSGTKSPTDAAARSGAEDAARPGKAPVDGTPAKAR